MTSYGVILFHTTSSVLKAEKLLIKAGYGIKLIPVPREFSSDCGIAVRFDWENCDKIKLLFELDKIEYEAIYPLDKNKL